MIQTFFVPIRIQKHFGTVNCKLQKICEWLRANKLSINVTKTNYSLFHKNSAKDKLPLKMSKSKIANSIIKMKSSFKFLGWMKICCGKIMLKRLKKELAKNIGLLYRKKLYLDETSLKKPYIFHIFIHI